MQFLCPIAAQHRVERFAIHRLRGHVEKRPALQAAFSALAHQARERQMAILPPNAPFLGKDEALLLAHLAIRQRSTLACVPTSDGHLERSIAECALTLSFHDLRLPYRSIQRLSFFSK